MPTIYGLAAAAVSALVMGFAVTPASADLSQTFSGHAKGSEQIVDHSAWDQLLKTYVEPGSDGLNRVRYAAFKSESHDALKAYVQSLEGVDVAKLDKPEQYAFWVNLYNAKTIDIVLDHYPVTSIRKISINEGLFGFIKKSTGFGGPWKAKVVTVAGMKLSLDDIEHAILRPIFKDPRVHYAVNCASIGCPNLQTEAFTGAKLEKMLDAGARAYVNSPRGFDVSDGSIKASSIYSWFQVDFGGDDASVLAHAAKYANDDLKAKLAKATGIDDFAYDWNLNDTR